MQRQKRYATVNWSIVTIILLSLGTSYGQKKPIVIQDQGSFAAGGTVVSAPGTFDPIKTVPAFHIEDIRGMADYITQHAGVDENRVGLLGICGGGGYSLKAAQTDKRFKRCSYSQYVQLWCGKA